MERNKMGSNIRITMAGIILIRQLSNDNSSCSQEEGIDGIKIVRSLKRGIDNNLCICHIETEKSGNFSESIFGFLFQNVPPDFVLQDPNVAIIMETIVQLEGFGELREKDIKDLSRKISENTKIDIFNGVEILSPEVIPLSDWGFWVIWRKPTDDEWRPWLFFYKDRQDLEDRISDIFLSLLQSVESVLLIRKKHREWSEKREQVGQAIIQLRGSRKDLQLSNKIGGRSGDESELNRLEELIIQAANPRADLYGWMHEFRGWALEVERALINLGVALRHLDLNDDHPVLLRVLLSPLRIFHKQLEMDIAWMEGELQKYERALETVRNRREIQSHRVERNINRTLLVISIIALVGVLSEIERIVGFLEIERLVRFLGLPWPGTYCVSLAILVFLSELIVGWIRRGRRELIKGICRLVKGKGIWNAIRRRIGRRRTG